ncbi:MAG: subclass B3 metallo-beta-lactamase [Pseudomonadota bacterium]
MIGKKAEYWQKFYASTAAFAGMLACSQAATPAFESDAQKVCSSCEQWNLPHEPFRIYGNSYYVGVAGLSSILIASDKGLIVLDGALPQSAPLIAENIRKLGFRVEDIRLIVNSHTHYDHAGGIAALQRASGATVAATKESAVALERGEPTSDDPQHAFGRKLTWFPPVPHARLVNDDEVLHVGDLAITAHVTPGHTPGGTTWTWRSCEDKRCLDVVYADSLSAVSAPDFRFTGDEAHPGRIESFNDSIALVAGLPCDVLLTPHPEFFDLESKLRRRQQPGANPFIDPQACKAYAATAKLKLEQRIAEESKR